MDVDRLLDIEKRTGVKNADIDEFLEKASAVEALVKGLKEGTVDPDKMPKIAGIETEEERIEREAIRQERLRVLQEKEETLRLKRRVEEKERWWAGAEFYRSNKDVDENVEEDENGGVTSRRSVMERYNFDYSRWDVWKPTDPVSMAEAEEAEKIEEAAKNEAFEKANPEFCQQHMDDLKERQKAVKKKQESSDISRLKGNRFFKQKDYDTALTYYTDALKVLPYDQRTLINIAQVNIKRENYDEATEYISRVLYLDPNHVKALSRQAFLLSERGELKSALISAEKALSLDVENKELIVQVDELRAAVISKEEEQRVKALLDGVKSVNMEDEQMLKSVKPEELIVASKFAFIQKLITRLRNNQFTPEKTSNPALVDISIPIDVNVFDACAELAETDDDLRVYARSEGVSVICSGFLSSSERNLNLKFVGPCLRLLAILVRDDRITKSQLLSSGVLQSEKEYLFSSHSVITSTGALETHLKYLNGSMQLLLECSKDSNICSALKFHDDSFFVSLSIIIECVGSYSGAISDTNHVVEVVAFYRSVSTIIKHYMFSKDTKSITQRSAMIVPVLGLALFRLSDTFPAIIASEAARLRMSGDAVVSATAELLIEALLGCSQCEVMRDAFSIPISQSSSTSTAEYLFYIPKSALFREMRPVCFGALMNLCLLPTSEKLKLVLVSIGAVEELVGIINKGVMLTELDRKKLEIGENLIDISGVELSRASGLLSRLCTVQDVVTTIFGPDKYYRILCKALARNVGIYSDGKTAIDVSNATSTIQGPQPGKNAWVLEERNNIIRVLSSFCNSLPKECKAVAAEEKLVLALVLIFPQPRQELGEITPSSVVLTPQEQASPLLLGNAARTLMQFADDEEYMPVIFGKSSVCGVERLICAMATCSDIRVRKNIAILLAKGCRFPGVKDRVTHFRGTEMIVELQSKF